MDSPEEALDLTSVSSSTGSSGSSESFRIQPGQTIVHPCAIMSPHSSFKRSTGSNLSSQASIPRATGQRLRDRQWVAPRQRHPIGQRVAGSPLDRSTRQTRQTRQTRAPLTCRARQTNAVGTIGLRAPSSATDGGFYSLASLRAEEGISGRPSAGAHGAHDVTPRPRVAACDPAKSSNSLPAELLPSPRRFDENVAAASSNVSRSRCARTLSSKKRLLTVDENSRLAAPQAETLRLDPTSPSMVENASGAERKKGPESEQRVEQEKAETKEQPKKVPEKVPEKDGAAEEAHEADEDGDESSEEEEEEDVPDADELRDMIEWDLGVAFDLYTMKAQQINEQIAMEGRQQKDARRATRAKGWPFWSRSRRNAPSSQALADCHRRRQSVVGNHASGIDVTGSGLRRASMRVSFNEKVETAGRGGATPDGNRRRSVCRASAMCDRAHNGTRVQDHMKKSHKFKLAHDEMRTRSQRALFEGLANTAEMSRDRWYIVRPWGARRQLWMILVSVSAAFVATSAPLVACGVCELSTGIYIIEMLCDALFLVDVVLHFLTAYQDELRDIIVTSPRHIRKRYMYGWFVVDLLGALPMDSLVRPTGWTSTANFMRCTKLMRIARVLLAGEWRMATVLGDTSINPSLVLALKLTVAMLLAWHWTACVYHMLSVVAPRPDDPTNTYITDHPWGSPPHILESSSSTKYLHALSWSIAATVGTIRPEPNTRAQLIFSDAMCLFGFIAMAWVVGAATTAVADLEHESQEMSQVLSRIARYMRRKNLPREIRLRVLSYYRFHQTSMNILEHEEVLVGLPRAMRIQISLLMHKPVFVQLPLFWLCTEEQMLFIVQRLRPCITTPGEMLVKEGTLGVGLFLLMKGAVETTRENELLVVLLAVAAFGEKALQSEEVSDMSIRALRFCETSILLRSDWLIIEKLNPQIRVWLDIYIHERDRRLEDPAVKAQSVQTKKATLRCGAGCGEWSSSTRAINENTRASQVAIRQAEHLRTREGWRNARRALCSGNVLPAKRLLIKRVNEAARKRAEQRRAEQKLPTPKQTAASDAPDGSRKLDANAKNSSSSHDLHVLRGVNEMRKLSVAAVAMQAQQSHKSGLMLRPHVV